MMLHRSGPELSRPSSTRPRSRWGAALLLAALAVPSFGLLGCSEDKADDNTDTGDNGGTDGGSETTESTPEVVNNAGTVEIAEYTYGPGEIKVPAGSTITWVNKGETRHTVTSDGDQFESSEPIQPDEQYIQAFPTVRTYRYYCTFHEEDMEGTIVVE